MGSSRPKILKGSADLGVGGVQQDVDALIEIGFQANGLIAIAHGSVYGNLYNVLKFRWDNSYEVPIKHLHLLIRYSTRV